MSITLLARSFPSLEHATGLDPWNPAELRRWAAEQAFDMAEQADFDIQALKRRLDTLESENSELRERVESLESESHEHTRSRR